MYKVNDKIIYKREVCIIKEIKEKYYHEKDYYCISPITDRTLTINIPVDSPLIKDILTKEQALNIIDSISKVEPILSDDKSLENYLYTSLSIPMNMTYEECKDYIIEKLEKEGK